MRPFDAILFDLGETLLHFEGNWPEVLTRSDARLCQRLIEAGLNLEPEAFTRDYRARLEDYYRERESEFIEHTALYVLRDLLAQCGYSDQPEEVLRQALTAAYAVSQSYWRVEQDAVDTLEWLRGQGYRLGLISNAADDQDVQTLVDNAGLRRYFDRIMTSASQGIRKPNPRLFLYLLEELRVPPHRAAMVGDTLGADVLGARNAGLFSVWIRRRGNTPANRAHAATILPDATIDSLSELTALLEKLETGQSLPGSGTP